MAGPDDFEQRIFIKTVATAGVPESLFAAGKKVKSFTIVALQGNTGSGSARHTDDQVSDAYPLPPQGAYGATDPDPAKAYDSYDLKDYFVDVATNGDGFFVIYQATKGA